MADLQAVLDEIGVALNSTISNLQVLTNPQEMITPPTAQIEATAVDWGEAMNRGHEHWDVTVRVLVASASEQAAHLELYKYFGQAKDIKDAIESHIPLRDGTAAEDVFVRRASNFGLYQVSGVGYRGVEFSLEVYA